MRWPSGRCVVAASALEVRAHTQLLGFVQSEMDMAAAEADSLVERHPEEAFLAGVKEKNRCRSR